MRAAKRETTMDEGAQRKSAQIIQFPVGGRVSAGARRAGAVRSVDLMPVRAANVACASGWYHEEAIKEETPKR